MSKDSSTFRLPHLPLLTKRSPQQIVGALSLGLGLLLAFWLVLGLGARVSVESLWFAHLGYLEVLWVRLGTKTVTWGIVTGLSLAFLAFNLRQAQRLKHSKLTTPSPLRPSRGHQRSPLAPPAPTAIAAIPPHTDLAFRWLLPFALGLSLLTLLLVGHYARVTFTFWQFSTSQPGTVPVIPSRFRFNTLLELLQLIAQSSDPIWRYPGVIGVLGLAIALLIYPKPLLWAIAIGLSIAFGSVGASNWSQILLFFHARPFERADPMLGRDIGFYLFALPIWQLLEFWLVGLFLFTLLACTLTYLLSGQSLSQGHFPGFSYAQRQHLCRLSSCVMLGVALSCWLSRYELAYSTNGVVFGAAYTEAQVQLPAATLLSVLAGAIAAYLLWQGEQNRPNRPTHPRFTQFTLPIPLLTLTLFLLLAIASSTLLPFTVQRLIVQPNELRREEPYLRRAISLTREAFNLEAIQVEGFNPKGNLTYQTLRANDQTIRNIRLWDTRPLLDTNRQLQQIRPYYRFFDADIDRYTVPPEASPTSPIPPTQPTKQQVLIAARELDYASVPPEAQTWVNEHLVYTHGYGFTLSPVNEVAPGGLPYYYVKDIGSSDVGRLSTSSDAISASIPIGEPRIYYGELTNTYVMTKTRTQELDYPTANDNAYNTYDGAGGLAMGTWWRRLLFARYLHDWQMIFTNYFTPETKVMFRRNINDRVRAIAPFLRFDRDPYLVTADSGCLGLTIGCPDQPAIPIPRPTPNYLYWIIDAYTVSDHYPYSEPSPIQGVDQPAAPGDRFNYIRNSVKVVIDAYNGRTAFYVADPNDPILRSWQTVFPNLFKPLAAMPATLRSHIRYPADLFSVQAERLRTYHMTDPQVFYNREDQWQIPTEIYGKDPQAVEPYFLITKLPTVVGAEEFILLMPYKPSERTNLIAWLAARSDGENYGKALLYVFPKQQLVYGIEQIEARINQDPVISQKISLWNRQGSKVLQGNLLVIPIEQSLLYVEPLYLVADQNSLPTLVSVVAAYENRIAMAETLQKTLLAIFQEQVPATPPIVRPVESVE